ncbi:MAG: T9SS type A sorting domain-containing protein, partial [Chlamydiia bacterium]|nr:T9SS type A sorting domain-containing protein [Chlamydiia bacterium]
ANNAPGDSILWFEDSLSVDAVFGGSPYITPWLNLNDTTFWVASVSGGPPVTSIIGTGSTSNSSQSYPSPYANYYWGNKEQYLILASEIIALGGSAGPISELAFDVASPNSCPNLQNFEMKIGASSQASLTTYETGLTTIFSSISGYQTINGWNNHIFSTPFIWDGISNIVIQVCSQNSGYVNNGNASVKRTTTSFNSVRYYRADNTGVCGNSSGTSSSLRPNMKMLISGTACQSDKTPVDITILPLSACDVGVSDLVGPTSSIYMGTNETVIAKVHNYGNVDQTNIPISYQINNGTIITENVSVPASSSVVYSFITKADFSNSGSVYNVKLSTSLSCDTTSLNNDYQELVSNIIPTYCVSSANYNSYHDIENVTVGSINNTSPSPFDKQYTDYTNINPGTLNPGNNYPISIKINSITSSPSGGFIKVFIDYNRDGVFDPTLEKAVAMPYNNASSNSPAMAYGSIVVPSNVDLGLTRMRVVAVRSGTATTVQPCGTYDYGETEDYPIYLANTIPHDASISMISSPSTLTTSSSVPVSVRVHNYGTDPISSVDISYSVNNNPSTIITYNSTSINQGNYVDVPLGNISIFDGMNNICARTILAGDSNIFNDSRCVNVFKEVIVNLSYSDDFEGVNLWMNDTVANQWERGSPNMTTINTAHSPSNVWATNLSGSYAGAAVQYLYSPKFDITSNIDSAQFEFWHYYITEVTNDGAYIQYKKNNGLWVALGYTTDPRATNWYTSTTGGIHKWTGNSGGWIQSTFNFNFLIGEFNNTNSIQFRYMFYSNSSNNNYDGWAIDDVSFNLPIAPSDVGVIAINTPATSVQVGETITVSIDVRNHGNNVQTTIPVWYQLNNDGIVTETLNISGSGLSLGDVATYNFTIPFVAPGTDFQLCVGTDLGVDDYPQNDDMCTSLAVTSANIDGGVTSVGILQSYVISGDTTIITDGDITNPITVIAEVKNFGVTTLTSFDIKYSKDGGSNWVTESWTGSLATNEVDTFEFVTTYNSPMGNYSICVRTDVPNDALAVNDENCAAYVGMVTIESAIENAFAVSQNEPNPAYGNVRIDYIVPTDGEIVFELLNSLGQMVYSADKASFVGDNSIEIDTKDFSSGVYYYTITFDGQRITRKMVVNQ